MIKINLLPKTINQKAILRNTAMVFGALLVAVIAGGVTYNMKLTEQVNLKVQEAERVEALKAQVESIQGQASSLLTSIQPIQQKLDFIDAVLKHNLKYPELYQEVAIWTYKNVQYTSLTCDGTSVTMNARVKNLDDLGRFLLNMYRATDLFTEVSITGVQGTGFAQTAYGNAGGSGTPGAFGMPGGAPAYQPSPSGVPSMAGIGAITAGVQQAPGQNWINFTVTCRLKTPIVPPAFGGGAPGGQQAGGDPNAAQTMPPAS